MHRIDSTANTRVFGQFDSVFGSRNGDLGRKRSMVELTRAHKELFRRNVDEIFSSMDELHRHCCLERETSKDCWQLPQDLRPHADGERLSLTLDGEGSRPERLVIQSALSPLRDQQEYAESAFTRHCRQGNSGNPACGEEANTGVVDGKHGTFTSWNGVHAAVECRSAGCCC